MFPYHIRMRPIPPSNAEVRAALRPMRTAAVLLVLGGVINLVRNLAYGIPVLPYRLGLTPFIICAVLGGSYAICSYCWLGLRRFYFRDRR